MNFTRYTSSILHEQLVSPSQFEHRPSKVTLIGPGVSWDRLKKLPSIGYVNIWIKRTPKVYMSCDLIEAGTRFVKKCRFWSCDSNRELWLAPLKESFGTIRQTPFPIDLKTCYYDVIFAHFSVRKECTVVFDMPLYDWSLLKQCVIDKISKKKRKKGRANPI